MKFVRAAIAENIVKNIVLVVLLFIGYFEIQSSFALQNFADKNLLGHLLAAVGLVSVIACFGNYAFTYEKVDLKNFKNRLLAHATTGLLMLVIGLTLEMTSVIVENLIGSFAILNLSLLLLYVGSVLYDFWDLKRAEIK